MAVAATVADSKYYAADQDPDATFHFDGNSDPDPSPQESDANLPPLVYRPFTAPF
jgi:hypothetical protein